MEVKRVKIEEINEVMNAINDAKSFLKPQSQQWQQGYPNEETMEKDIRNHNLFGVYLNNELTCVAALIIGIEKTYVNMVEGKWEIPVSSKDLVIHRIAVKEKYRGTGCAKKMMRFAEEFALRNSCPSIKVDTHRANIPMQKLVLSHSYKYCGIIDLNRNEEDQLRLAYEKIISKN